MGWGRGGRGRCGLDDAEPGRGGEECSMGGAVANEVAEDNV